MEEYEKIVMYIYFGKCRRRKENTGPAWLDFKAWNVTKRSCTTLGSRCWWITIKFKAILWLFFLFLVRNQSFYRSDHGLRRITKTTLLFGFIIGCGDKFVGLSSTKLTDLIFTLFMSAGDRRTLFVWLSIFQLISSILSGWSSSLTWDRLFHR
jgi:hypothetical protein